MPVVEFPDITWKENLTQKSRQEDRRKASIAQALVKLNWLVEACSLSISQTLSRASEGGKIL